MTFEYEIQEAGEIKITLKGRLLEKSQALDLLQDVERLLGQNKILFIIDLKEMEYMNSTGLNVLINILTVVKNKGGQLRLVNLPSRLEKLLLVTKLNSIFEIETSKEQSST